MRADDHIRSIIFDEARQFAFLEIGKLERKRFFYALVPLVAFKNVFQRPRIVTRNIGIAFIDAFTNRSVEIGIGIQNAALHPLGFR